VATPLVIVMSSHAFASLAPDQQSILRDVAAAMLPDGLADARAEDARVFSELCAERMTTLAVASRDDLSALRAAFEPVYRQLASDPATEEYVDKIQALKTKLAAPAEGSQCPAVEPASQPNATEFPEGTYDTILRADDWTDSCAAKLGVDKTLLPVEDHLEATFDAGTVQQLFVKNDGAKEKGYFGTYKVFRDRIEFTDEIGVFSARWSFDGKNLFFTDVDGECDGAIVWGSHPWVHVS
jgi:extracellular solute-binding protein (family 7)